MTPQSVATPSGESGAAPDMFTRERIGEGGAARVATLVALLDAQEQQPAVRRLRTWAFEAVAPQPGESVVDVGAGTGTELRRLADAVAPNGRAVGIEPNPGLREVAAQRAALMGSTGTFIDGDAADLPFADGAVHVLRCERVFQHLRDPQAAAHEFARVLAPGGRVAVLDSDWGTVISHPGDPDVVRRYTEAARARMPNPFAARHLPHQLRTAGLLVDHDIGSAALVMPPRALLGSGVVHRNADAAVEDGALTREEADRLLADAMAAARSGTAFYSVTMFGVVGRKPG
ncbi:methyltransferase domain-containing protein [Terrabacter aerolatus]|uniref:Methyltransferase n=1 Tax=Terrabacter aerolatus TaxID=422442 RepID=A0A512CWC1_9MICO|nr:methyltransferase domain-containing protein [Terrabacter aerolatus]GEO28496.1 methyltransferase [Terrabacter aerolatus]